jgi:antitoxin component YwqK of YwqJK toxin-antitoxin module
MKKLFAFLFFLSPLTFFCQSSGMSDTAANFVEVCWKRTGYWIITGKMVKNANYPLDAKVEEGNYDNGNKIGIWKAYFPNGILKSEINYKNNRACGQAILYFENGKISEEGNWNYSRWNDSYKMYYDNGQLCQSFFYSKSGLRQGMQYYYYSNGQLAITINCVNGKESGVKKEYDETGFLFRETTYYDGVIDVSKTKNYVRPEQVKEQVKPPRIDPPPPPQSPPPYPHFEDGNVKLYNANHQLAYEGLFHKKVFITGKQYIYNENGILIQIKVYKDGKYVGDAPIEN